MSEATQPELPLGLTHPEYRWFGDGGCVIQRGELLQVWMGGTLIGEFGEKDRGLRNLHLVVLAETGVFYLGVLAKAFGVTLETLRLLRELAEKEGLGALMERRSTGRPKKMTAQMEEQAEACFAAEMTSSEISAVLRKQGQVSARTLRRARLQWKANTARTAVPDDAVGTKNEPRPTATVKSQESWLEGVEPTQERVAPAMAQTEDGATTKSGQGTIACEEAPIAESEGTPPSSAEPSESATVVMREFDDDKRKVESVEPRSGRFIQHLGTWIMIAMVARLELYSRAAMVVEDRAPLQALRVVLDAVIAALSIGQNCVEGVRRLATRTAGRLLRADSAPSASWSRKILGRFAAELGGAKLHLSMAGHYVRQAKASAAQDAVVLFYIDNHMRPYTGHSTLRRGWRMQDKRARPGTTDYYVHDEEGRPVLRVDAPAHDSLTAWLLPIARILRDVLGAGPKILLAFDRAGAFPEHMASLRNEDFDFVTYERKPYPQLPASAFTETLDLDDETVPYCASRINLGSGRGRVKRIALRTEDNHQINLLCVGDLPVSTFVAAMRNRWRQENGFKHGVQRWGINQLDGRQTIPYPSDTIIPNPARRKADRARRLLHVREGRARRQLAKLPKTSPKRKHLTRELNATLEEIRHLEALLPSIPSHAAVKDTELADTLVHHPSEYKLTVDTIRIACANAEAELATTLAEHLRRPDEAKKTLANLLAAPGHAHVTTDAIHVTLIPPGTHGELRALDKLLEAVNQWGLVLPGDPKRRPLRFRVQDF